MKKASIIRKVFFTLHFSLFTLLLVSSCKTVEQEHIEVRTDTVQVFTHHRDSIVHRDSVFTHVYEKGDTVYSITERWNVRYIDRVHTDTVYKARSVEQSQKEIKEKEKPWWKDPWPFVAVACLAFVVYVAVSERRK